MTFASRLILICVLTAVGAITVVAMGSVSPAGADINQRIAGNANRAETLRAAVAAQTRRIRSSASALAAARRRLNDLQADNVHQQAQLKTIQDKLVRTRDRLTRLVSRQRTATDALRANLDTAYRNGTPDIVSVVITVDGFAQLLETVEFLKRISRQNARIMDTARTSRVAVARQADSLAKLQAREQRLARALQHSTDQARVVQSALLRAQQARLARRARASAELRAIRNQLAKLRRRLVVHPGNPCPYASRVLPVYVHLNGRAVWL